MIPVFKKKYKLVIWLLVVSNIALLICALLFFDYYKKRKINQYNTLYENKQEEIKNIESIFSHYYHTSKKFVFNRKETKIINSKKNSYILNKIDTNLYFAKVTGKSSAYLELYKNDLILASASGLFFKIKNEQLDNQKIIPKKINSNIEKFFNNKKFYLRSNFGIKDILVQHDELYVSYNNEFKKNCYNTGVLKAKINENYLIFKKFFNHHECKSKENSKYKTFSVNQAGGRFIDFKENFLLTHGSYSEFDEVQDSKSIFGKILLIDKNGNLKKIYSKGHRNPQGLNLFENNIIFQTEHGPSGGDEINIIKEDENYGWPLASYGNHYEGQSHVGTYYPLPKPHHNFVEPIKFFKKSIAISQIINVPNIFDKTSKSSIFLASMKINEDYGEKINLYKFKFKEKNLNLDDIIPIGERIRDIIYSEKRNELIMFLDTSASIAFLSASKK
tara:strand:- start:1587 stop:2924 length:1338 start_codon:yes stop_codon:yes gene_type:complete